jgi:hypothetical protein
MSDYITSESVFASYDKEFLMSLAGGRPWVLHDMLDKAENVLLLQEVFTEIVKDKKASSITSIYKKLCLLAKSWLEIVLLHALQYHFATQQQWNKVGLVQETIWLAEYAINMDHILFDFISAFHAANQE